MRFHIQAYITLRPSILDPAGVAVESSLHTLNHQDVSGVRIGKYIQFDLEAPDPEVASQRAETICEQVLANSVIETYRVVVDPVAE
jgi:phosphoribosylformylglycinamidine synthase